MMRLRLSHRARADLDGIWLYTAQRWSVEQAEAYLRGIGQAVTLLCENPRLGRDASEIKPGYFKSPALSHVIYYKLPSGTLDVIRILHKSMDTEHHL